MVTLLRNEVQTKRMLVLPVPCTRMGNRDAASLTKRFSTRAALTPWFASLGIRLDAERLPLRQQIWRVNQSGDFGEVRLCHAHRSKVALPIVDHGNDLEDGVGSIHR